MILAAVVVSFLCCCFFVPVALFLSLKGMQKLAGKDGEQDVFCAAILQRVAEKSLEKLEKSGSLEGLKK